MTPAAPCENNNKSIQVYFLFPGRTRFHAAILADWRVHSWDDTPRHLCGLPGRDSRCWRGAC